ncbi:MAG: hypothetical protein ACRDQG_03365 [Pseudonocardiaceae bacterium]
MEPSRDAPPSAAGDLVGQHPRPCVGPRRRGTLVDVTEQLLTEGDLDRGHLPDLNSPHWRCRIVDPTTGAVCTRRPHADDVQHKGWAAAQGAGRSTRLVSWAHGTERAMIIIDGYVWTRVPGTNIEVRALTDRRLALRYRLRA